MKGEEKFDLRPHIGEYEKGTPEGDLAGDYLSEFCWLQTYFVLLEENKTTQEAIWEECKNKYLKQGGKLFRTFEERYPQHIGYKFSNYDDARLKALNALAKEKNTLFEEDVKGNTPWKHLTLEDLKGTVEIKTDIVDQMRPELGKEEE